jgi:hypothetical protein
VGDREAGNTNDEGVMGEGVLTMPLTQGQKEVIRLELPEAIPSSPPVLQVRWKSESMPKGGIVDCRLSPPT